MQQSTSEAKSRLACEETLTPRRFVTSFVTLRHSLLAPSHINPVNIISSYFFQVHFNTALPSTSRASCWSLCFRFYDKIFLHIAHFSRACNMLCPPHLPTIDDLNNICRTVCPPPLPSPHSIILKYSPPTLPPPPPPTLPYSASYIPFNFCYHPFVSNLTVGR